LKLAASERRGDLAPGAGLAFSGAALECPPPLFFGFSERQPVVAVNEPPVRELDASRRSGSVIGHGYGGAGCFLLAVPDVVVHLVMPPEPQRYLAHSHPFDARPTLRLT